MLLYIFIFTTIHGFRQHQVLLCLTIDVGNTTYVVLSSMRKITIPQEIFYIKYY